MVAWYWIPISVACSFALVVVVKIILYLILYLVTESGF